MSGNKQAVPLTRIWRKTSKKRLSPVLDRPTHGIRIETGNVLSTHYWGIGAVTPSGRLPGIPFSGCWNHEGEIPMSSFWGKPSRQSCLEGLHTKTDAALLTPQQMTERIQAIHYSCSPSSWPVPASIPSLFSWEQDDVLKVLCRNPFWILRDGLLPLLWFFMRFPSPGPFRGRIAVDERWQSVIPKSWLPRCKTYRIDSWREGKEMRDVLVSSVALNASSCSRTGLRRETDRIRDLIGKTGAIRPQCLKIAIHFRDQVAGPESRPDFAIRFFAELEQQVRRDLGLSVEVVPFEELTRLPCLPNSVIMNLNSGLLCSDDHVLHRLLAQGAIIGGSKPKAGAEWHTVSALHGYWIQDPARTPETARQSGRLESIRNHFSRRRDKIFSRRLWPDWLEQLASELQT